MSIRLKMIVSFFLTAAATALAATGLLYYLLRDSLTEEIRGRLGDIAHIGATALDSGALTRLAARLDGAFDETRATEVEASADYRRILGQLQAIREAEPKLIQFAYVLVPSANQATMRFLVDADVCDLLARRTAGEKIEEEISRFGLDYDISDKRFIQQALREGALVVEEEFVPDPKYRTASLSAYAPVRDERGRVLGLLGIDLKDVNMRAALLRSAVTSAVVITASIMAALAVSVLVGSRVTRGIRSLDSVVRRFAARDFEVRAPVLSHDEVGRLSQSFNDMAQSIDEHSRHRELLLQAYGRFVPHSFLEFLQKKSVIDLRLGDHVQREMTVLFSDIRSFTALSETMTPRENFDFVNAFLRRVGPVIREHGGIVDKYIGDAVMALFPGTATDAARAAVALQQSVSQYNVERRAAGFVPIEIGVGLHGGRLILGTVGESERMNSTVISSVVNLASRLEGVTKHYQVGIVVSDATRKQFDPGAGFSLRFLDRLLVVGVSEPVAIHELYDADPEDRRAVKAAFARHWQDAVALYGEQRFAEALAIFQEIAAAMPDDQPAMMYVERSARYLRDGVPPGWVAVEVMASK